MFKVIENQTSLPTEVQIKEFGAHVCNVHSWYKHISLIQGMSVYFFLSQDSGTNYPTRHPRLKYGNNLDGYRKQFGFLDYAFDSGDGRYRRDGADELSPGDIEKIEKKVGIRIYPYIHSEIYWSIFSSDFTILKNGYIHEDGKALRRFIECDDICIGMREFISIDEREYIIDIDDCYEDLINQERSLSSEAREYNDYRKEQLQIYYKLQCKERMKVERGLNQLLALYA